MIFQRPALRGSQKSPFGQQRHDSGGIQQSSDLNIGAEPHGFQFPSTNAIAHRAIQTWTYGIKEIGGRRSFRAHRAPVAES